MSTSALGPGQLPRNPKLNQVFEYGNCKYIFNNDREWMEIENKNTGWKLNEPEKKWIPHY